MFYELNNNVRKLRKSKEMTVQQLADRLQLNMKSLSNFESGLRNCSIEVLVDLSRFFKVSIDDLIFKKL